MRQKIWISFMMIVSLYIIVTSIYSRTVTIHLGIFVDNWGVPNGESYKIIDNAIARFEQKHPGVHIEYESGILKDDYQGEQHLWLAW